MTIDSFWVWLIIGFLFLASELLSGAFVLVFFGIAGLATSVLAFLGVSHPAILVCFFAVISLINLLFFRKRLIEKRGGSTGPVPPSVDSGNSIILSDRLPAQGEGVISYQGSPWTAINLGAEPLEKGTFVRIVKTEGIKLYVQREK